MNRRPYQQAEVDKYHTVYRSPKYKMGEWRLTPLHNYLRERRSDADSVLDVGCGRSESILIAQAHGYRSRGCEVLPELCPHESVDEIPGAHDLSRYADDSWDIVLCLDVMEHIPERDVITVLHELCRVAKKFVHLSISSRPSLHKGVVLHVTVKPRDWWLEQIAKVVPPGDVRLINPGNLPSKKDGTSHWLEIVL